MNAKDLKEKPDSGQKRKLGWLGYLIAIGYPLPVTFVLFCVFDIIYLGLGSIFCLVMMILTVVGYLVVVFLLLHSFSKPTPSSIYDSSARFNTATYRNDIDSDSDEASALAVGMLGGVLLGRAIGKHSSANRDENDFLWQEKIRRDMYDNE